VRVAACQVSLSVGETGRNQAAARQAIEAAADGGAQIVVLPELTPSGYVFIDQAEARSLAEPADGPTAAQWSQLAARHGLVIVGGICELGEQDRVYNSAILVDPGGLRSVYRKAHLWDAEPDFFVPGDAEPQVTNTLHGRIAVMICYDVEFPEWVRRPALAGAELLAVPTNWPAEPVPAGQRPMVVANVQVAAYANRMFIAAACRCGTERGVSWVGGSIIAGPDGYPLAGPAGADEPELVVADCELQQARSKALSTRSDVHADRRTDLYGLAGR
jgi:predicted amidohydrolase